MAHATRHFYEFGQFRLDADRHRLLRDGEVVPLSPKAIEALLVLAKNPGKPLDREELMKAVWTDTFVEDANLTVAISHLRKALGQNGDTPEYIETVPRVGYKFVADVREIVEEPAPLVIEKRTLSRTVIEEELVHDATQEQTTTEAITVRPTVNRLWFPQRRKLIAATVAMTTLSLVVLTSVLYLKRDNSVIGLDRAAISSIHSIAVLPPKSLVDESNNAPLSLGLADALITRLGGLRRVVVRPTTAVVRYEGNNGDSLNAGRELGVDAVLEGTLQREQGRTRVTLRLLSVINGAQLWSGNFDEADQDVFKLEDDVSQQVAQTLFSNLSPDERTSLTRRQTTNPEAYALFLRGNYYLQKRMEGVPQSLEWFRKAITLDPNFVDAYVRLAAADAINTVPSPEAEALIDKALRLDDNSADAHATNGFIRMFHHWDWTSAEKEFDRAVELNPNSVMAHHWRGVYLSVRGRLSEAKAEMHRALDLDPQSLIVMADLGQLHYFDHEYDQAIDFCNRVLAQDNSFELAHEYRRNAYLMNGMKQEFFDEYGKPAPNVQIKFARAGIKEVLREELKRPDVSGSLNFSAWINAAVEDRNGTIESLNKLLQAHPQGDIILPFLNVDPVYDFLRDDPRFKELLRRMNLP